MARGGYQQAHLIKLHVGREHSIADLAELFSASRATVYRVLVHARRMSVVAHRKEECMLVAGRREPAQLLAVWGVTA